MSGPRLAAKLGGGSGGGGGGGEHRKQDKTGGMSRRGKHTRLLDPREKKIVLGLVVATD